MDCCNYIEAYAAGGHFYQQQQQYFCYDNGSVAYTGYDAAPISNAIDINARYNGAIPPTYPTGRKKKTKRMSHRNDSLRSLARTYVLFFIYNPSRIQN